MSSGDKEAGLDLGDVYEAAGRYAEAEQAYLDAIGAGVLSGYISYGNLLDDHLGRPEDAERQYQAALEAGVDVPWALYNLSVLYRNQGRREESRAFYAAALEAGYVEDE